MSDDYHGGGKISPGVCVWSCLLLGSIGNGEREGKVVDPLRRPTGRDPLCKCQGRTTRREGGREGGCHRHCESEHDEKNSSKFKNSVTDFGSFLCMCAVFSIYRSPPPPSRGNVSYRCENTPLPRIVCCLVLAVQCHRLGQCVLRR